MWLVYLCNFWPFKIYRVHRYFRNSKKKKKKIKFDIEMHFIQLKRTNCLWSCWHNKKKICLSMLYTNYLDLNFRKHSNIFRKRQTIFSKSRKPKHIKLDFQLGYKDNEMKHLKNKTSSCVITASFSKTQPNIHELRSSH